MGETRRFTRVPYQSEVLLNANGQWYRGMSENLSLYGIYLKSIPKFDINSIVELTIPLQTQSTEEEDEYIDVKAVVVRQDESGVGCEFNSVDVDAFLNLRNVIGSRFENKNLVMDEFYSYLSRKELMVN